LNNQEGWVAGAGDVILFTQDGGVTWKQSKLNLRKGAIIYKILFLNQQTGWAVGQYSDDASLVLHTADGGKNWKVQYEGQGDKAAFDLYFLNSQEGWVVGNTYIDNTPLQRGFILHTEDGGESWERQDMDEMAQAIHFITPENGFLVGLHNALLETKDGGKNWISRFKRGYRLTDVTFRPGGKGWIAANSDQQSKFATGMTQILQTTDAGQTWELISELPSSASQSLYFHDSQHGISVGFKIDKTQDGGKTWTVQERPEDFLNAVDFATNEQGVAVGKQGRIYLTHDGGATWEQLKEVTDADLHDVQFINDKEGSPSNEVKGWIVGGTFRKGVVLHTRDGGKSWNNLADMGDTVFALQMLDSRIGWAVGEGGNIWHTQNGGQNWQLQLTRYPTFYDVLFLDANKGWAVGAEGTIVSTTDGGRTWQKQNSLTDAGLTQIAYNYRNALIAVGDWNTILCYQDDSLSRYALFSVDVIGRNSSSFLFDQTFSFPKRKSLEGKLLTNWGFVKSQLYQNFPNPFNPETWIPYQLVKASEVKIFIYNSQGKLVRRLDLGRQLAGTYLSKEQAVYWNGRNENGESVSSGVYFYTLQSGDFRSTKRMVLLK
jgi:photosystem II stability/assembly factor-like uncharacterized protein